MKKITGNYNGSGKKIAIIESRFNEVIVEQLVKGAEDMLLRHGVEEKNMVRFQCPGAFEIPTVAAKIAESKKYDAIICLGAVIKGATPHFDYVSGQVASGIASVGLQYKMPVIFGVLTTNTVEEAWDRSGLKAGNKGADAALSALEMIDLLSHI